MDWVLVPGTNKKQTTPLCCFHDQTSQSAEGSTEQGAPSSAWWVRPGEFTQSRVGLPGIQIPWKLPPLPFTLVLGITPRRKLKHTRSQPHQKNRLGVLLASGFGIRICQSLSSHPLTQANSPASCPLRRIPPSSPPAGLAFFFFFFFGNLPKLRVS